MLSLASQLANAIILWVGAWVQVKQFAAPRKEVLHLVREGEGGVGEGGREERDGGGAERKRERKEKWGMLVSAEPSLCRLKLYLCFIIVMSLMFPVHTPVIYITPSLSPPHTHTE